MSLPTIKAIKDRYPKAKLDILAGPWAVELIKGLPYIDDVIVYKSFRMDKSRRPFMFKMIEDIRQIIGTVRELRIRKYDIGIDFRPHWSPGIPLMWLGKVKYRVGFGSGGGGFLLNREIEFEPGIHIQENFRKILKSFPGIDMSGNPLPIGKEDLADAQSMLKSAGIDRAKMILINPGAGNPVKLWQDQRWAELADKLIEEGYQVAFAGAGSDKGMIANIIGKMKHQAYDLSGQGSIFKFFSLLSLAALYLGVDSMGGHAAALLGIKGVVLFSGISDPANWRPYSENIGTLSQKIDCSPCYCESGCRKMACMDIAVESVYRKLREILK